MKNSIFDYIPKSLHPYVAGADSWKNPGERYECISVVFNLLDKNGEQTGFVAHGVKELKWACKQVLNGERGEIF